MIQLKNLALILLTFITSTGFSQIQSNCEVPQNLQTAYATDVANLTVKRLYQNDSPDTCFITIPQIHQDSIWEGLATIFNASSVPGRDSIFDIFCIHQENQNIKLRKDILVYTDSSSQWTEYWQNLEILTGDSELDNLLSYYGFSIESYTDISYSDSYDGRVKFITEQDINTIAFCDSLETFEGIHHASPNSSYLEGNDIDYNVIEGVKYFDFRLINCGFDWGTCYYYTWKYEVHQDCYVDFAGIIAETYELPDPQNCNITTHSDNNYSNSINIYPNPTKGEVSISINDKEIHNFSLEVSDIHGKIILKKEIQTNNLRLDLPNGLYFLKLTDKENVYTKKLIINK